MKVAVIFSNKKGFLPAFMTNWLTGCRAYHIAFYCRESGYLYDMNVMRRRIKYTDYMNENKYAVFFDCKVTEEYLISQIVDRKEAYGWRDYLLFFYRWLGFKVKDRKGLICSEMVNEDLKKFESTPWPVDGPPPSPCDIFEWYKNGSQSPKT